MFRDFKIFDICLVLFLFSVIGLVRFFTEWVVVILRGVGGRGFFFFGGRGKGFCWILEIRLGVSIGFGVLFSFCFSGGFECGVL